MTVPLAQVPAYFETGLSYHKAACRWGEALSTLVVDSLREMRDSVARVIRAAAAEGYELRLKRMAPAAVRIFVSQPLVFVVMRAPAADDAEAAQARLTVEIDRELNGSKTPREMDILPVESGQRGGVAWTRGDVWRAVARRSVAFSVQTSTQQAPMLRELRVVRAERSRLYELTSGKGAV